MIFDAALPTEIYYDRTLKRYRYTGGDKQPMRGTFVSRKDAIDLQTKFLGNLKSDFMKLSPRILSGDIGSYTDAANILKKIHMSHAIISAGGIDKIQLNSLGSIGNVLKNQYYRGRSDDGTPFGLKHLLKEAVEKPLSEKMLRHRLNLYIKSGEISGHIVAKDTAISENKTLVKRILNHGDNCPDCIRYASYGWVGINTKLLPYPKTMCICRANCNCDMIYS